MHGRASAELPRHLLVVTVVVLLLAATTCLASDTRLLTMLNPGTGAFGQSSAIVGGNILIGAEEAAYLFDGETGALLRTFLCPDPGLADRFGSPVAAITDRYAAIAAPGSPPYTTVVEAGAVYVFDTLTGDLISTLLQPGPFRGALFGEAVAGVGGNVLVGAMDDETLGVHAGMAYLFDPATGLLLRTFQSPDPAHIHFVGQSLAAFGDDALISTREAALLFDPGTGELLRTFPLPPGMGYRADVTSVGADVIVGMPYYTEFATQTNMPGRIEIFDEASGELLRSIGGSGGGGRRFLGARVAALGDSLLVATAYPADPVEGPVPNIPTVIVFDVSSGTGLRTVPFGEPDRTEDYPWFVGTWGDLLLLGEDTPDGTAVSLVRLDHTLALSITPSATRVGSCKPVALNVWFRDPLGHTGQTWRWTDGGAGGSFLPSAKVQNPTYITPPNRSGKDKAITLRVCVTCNESTPPATGSAQVTITVPAHTLSVSATATVTTLTPGQSTALHGLYVDSGGHTGLAWSWSDGGVGGTFSPSANVRNPTYTVPASLPPSVGSITITVTGTCKWYWPWLTASNILVLTMEIES